MVGEYSPRLQFIKLLLLFCTKAMSLSYMSPSPKKMRAISIGERN